MTNTLAIRIRKKAGRDLESVFALMEEEALSVLTLDADTLIFAFDDSFMDLEIDLLFSDIGRAQVSGFTLLNFSNPVTQFIYADPLLSVPVNPGELYDELLDSDVALELTGSKFSDRVVGLSEDDLFTMKDGKDYVAAGRGDDTVDGGAKRDTLLGEVGDDMLSGGNGKDLLNGGEGRDTLLGEAGLDRLVGGKQGDLLGGGAGHDVLEGGGGSDMLVGGAGDDHVSGGAGADVIVTGADSDMVSGGGGNDLIIWRDPDLEALGRGVVDIDGGTGRDTVVLLVDEAEREGIEAEMAARTDADIAAGHWSFLHLGLTLESVETVELRGPGEDLGVTLPDAELFAMAGDLGLI